MKILDYWKEICLVAFTVFVFTLTALADTISWEEVPPNTPVNTVCLTNTASGGGGAVASVNGKTGAVVLTAEDVDAVGYGVAAQTNRLINLQLDGRVMSLLSTKEADMWNKFAYFSFSPTDGYIDWEPYGEGEELPTRLYLPHGVGRIALKSDVDAKASLNGSEDEDFAVSQLTVINGIDASACDIETIAITAAGESGEHTLHSYRWEYRPEAGLPGDREIAVREDVIDGTYPLVTKTGASVTLENHRRNIVAVADGQSVTIAALAPLPTDFDAVVRLSIGAGSSVNWATATNGLSVYQPKGNKALEFETGKSYLIGITASGAASIDISKQELEAL